MLKKFSCIVIIFIILFSLYFSFKIGLYLRHQDNNKAQITYCSLNKEDNECFNKMFELLLPDLLLYDVKIDSKELELIRLDFSSRLTPLQTIKNSDILLGYGIDDDIEYESTYSMLFDKPAYCYDCGIRSINTTSPKTYFYSECIGTDKYILSSLGQVSSKKIHTYKQKYDELNLKDKKVFIKMDIAGAEVEVLPEILEYSDNITGMLIVMHFNSGKDLIDRFKIIKALNKDFILVSRNFLWVIGKSQKQLKTKYADMTMTDGVLSLTYINKNNVDDYKISWQQDALKYYANTKIHYIANYQKETYLKNNINITVTITEKLKQLAKKYGKFNLWNYNSL